MKKVLAAKWAVVLCLLGLGTGLASAQTLYIDTNHVWRYLADGSDQGTAWTAPGFDDVAWASGPGVLGFGDAWIRTTIPNAAAITYYFRTTINITGAGAIANLQASHMRDDGFVLYVNGVEAFRDNMPTGPILSSTVAGANTGTENAFRTNLISPALLVEGDNTIAVEVHQTGTGSSDLTWYLELRGDVPPQPPVAVVANPTASTVIQAANVTLNATATDIDGTVTQVEFFRDGLSVGVDTTAPYGLVWNGAAPGNHVLTAVATDSQALLGTSAPVTITVVTPLPSLIPFGASWRYRDNGVEQAALWVQPPPVFDDSGWSSGVAELGYGDNDEATLIRRTGDDSTTNITTYFRHTFNVANPASISSLVLRLVRDDGVIVYLNGTEVLRDNFTNAVINYLTTAAVAVEDEPILVTNVSPALLVAGDNTVAVEVHQSGITSSDVSFDLQLIPNTGTLPPVVLLTTPPNGTNIVAPADIVMAATAYDLDGSISNVQFFVDGALIGAVDMTVPYGRTATGVGIGNHAVMAIATDNSGLTSTAMVSVVVTPGSVLNTLVDTNSVWKYLDDGSDQGTAWQAGAFDDSTWLAGRAELGYGDGDEVTVLNRTNSVTGMTNVTFYFRHKFTVKRAATYTNVVARLRRDDGGVVYLNGMEVFRSNMPVGPVNYLTFAAANTPSETAFDTTNLPPAVLVDGENIVAVEIHQQTLASSDVSFEFQLHGQRAAAAILSIVTDAGGTHTLSWFPNTPGAGLQETGDICGTWVTSANQSNPQVLSPASAQKFYRICIGCP